MGKGRPRAVEKGGLAHAVAGGAGTSVASSSSSSSSSSSGCSGGVPQAPVFYPTEEEFEQPLEYIDKIRPQAEPFGICRIVPPKSWDPPFALDRDAFAFPTKSQEIHLLQARPASCDPKTFDLDYGRFLESHFGRKLRRRVVFEDDDLDLCGLFNAVKRYGGYAKVCDEKRWKEVAQFVRPAAKISECAKHVLCQLYREHLYDYEEHNNKIGRGAKKGKRGRPCEDKKSSRHVESSVRKRRRRRSACTERVKEVVQETNDQICEQCKSGLHGDVMLLCDRCDRGWHLYCLSPPLESIPSGNWYCSECMNSDKDAFGFMSGKLCTLEQFRRTDDRTRRKWFGQANVSPVQMEKRFWEIVEGKSGEVEVMYGSDLDTSLYGSGFPRVQDPILSSVDPNAWRQYASSPWNLNNLPKLRGSMLHAVHENIAGVMVPWLYIGMLFSSFCWHVEDHCFYSINYLHWGAPKCWYGVPGSEANAFEKVMRNALPDLFEAQPDLLFQLVTMLNPSILQSNNVSVYGVLQEPGNFVITFPRSFHAGFNFGLNCAEAVNFAPADWLPHGRIGAELYRLYHKAPVISHEELLCVASKNGCDARTLPYLKEEMQKVFDKEKKCREELWVNGIIKSSQMVPKKYPNFVGTEEDPTCIICQQHLYLSAIRCSCRPSAFVCLEHWRHLCECSPDKYHFLYRHNLAELGDLIPMLSPALEAREVVDFSHISRHGHLGRNRSNPMTKKVKGGDVSYVQLAEDWLSNTCHIFEVPFSDSACANALKEAEQFLWADHDMDPVREMVSKLVEFQRGTLNLRSCHSKIDDYVQKKNNEKVPLCELEQLLKLYPLHCNEPALTILKAYAEDARTLSAKVESALSSSLNIVDLENIYSTATEFPIDLGKIDMLASEISSAKAWLNAARLCILEKRPVAIHIDVLNNLKLEMLELRVHLPEMDLLSKLSIEVESWQIRCEELLKSPIKLKELEEFLQGTENLTVSIPGINLLRKYRSEAHSWICSLHNDLQKLKEREDHDNIVRELSNLLKAGESLEVQVDELPLVEAELKRSICRERASKALNARTPLNIIEEILMEASRLQIEHEPLFVDISKLVERAISWEEKAKSILEHGAQVFEFDDIIRDSDDILVSLPSLMGIKNAISLAKSWISRSQPYLEQATHIDSYAPLLKVGVLKDLVNESKLLKATLDTPERLQCILREVEGWEHNAYSFLQNLKSFINMHYADFLVDNHLSTKIEELLNKVDSTSEAGQSLGFEFEVFPQLRNASFFLKCCLKALSFCHIIPLREEVDSLLGDMDQLPVVFSGSPLAEVLIRGTNWLRKAQLIFPEVLNFERCKLADVQLILDEIQKIEMQYPMMVTQLQRAIEKHKSWVKQVQVYFSLLDQQSWPALLKLKECGETDAFECEELDKVGSEIGKVEGWMSDCNTALEPSVGKNGSLSDELVKIKSSLDRALCIYHSFKGRREKTFCVCCPGDPGKEVYTCLTCEDWYHLSCVGPPLSNAGTINEYSCPFCHCIESGSITRNGGQALICKGNRPEVQSFYELLCTGEDLCEGINELKLVEEIVGKIKECKSYLTKIVNDVSSHCDKDLSSISDSLLIALKAMSVAAVYDHQDFCNLQLALSTISWKTRVKKLLLKGSKKPVIQQIQRLLKEGKAMNMPSEDHFMKEITRVMRMSLQWTEIVKKVVSDSGELALSEVYKLIIDGQNLPIHFEKELKLLKTRSELYCICRMPYDHRAMVACDQCDEWYHFDCINLHGPPPKIFYCPACKPADGELITLPCTTYHDDRCINDGWPQTPPSCSSASREKRRVIGCIAADNLQDRIDLLNILRSSSNIDYLWRKNKKPFQRTAKRRNKLGLLRYFRSQVVND